MLFETINSPFESSTAKLAIKVPSSVVVGYLYLLQHTSKQSILPHHAIHRRNEEIKKEKKKQEKSNVKINICNTLLICPRRFMWLADQAR